jgi:hypothetical protein
MRLIQDFMGISFTQREWLNKAFSVPSRGVAVISTRYRFVSFYVKAKAEHQLDSRLIRALAMQPG